MRIEIIINGDITNNSYFRKIGFSCDTKTLEPTDKEIIDGLQNIIKALKESVIEDTDIF